MGVMQHVRTFSLCALCAELSVREPSSHLMRRKIMSDSVSCSMFALHHCVYIHAELSVREPFSW